MPTEFRHIIFSMDELLLAVMSYRRKRQEPLPPGSVLQHKLGQTPDLHLTLRIAPDDSKREVRFVIDREELAQAAITYCIDRKIPMPIESMKFIQLFGDSLGLVITKNVALAEIHRMRF